MVEIVVITVPTAKVTGVVVALNIVVVAITVWSTIFSANVPAVTNLVEGSGVTVTSI